MGNHIITFAEQTHNGEQSEPHNSKLKQAEKEQTYKIYSCVFALSVMEGDETHFASIQCLDMIIVAITASARDTARR